MRMGVTCARARELVAKSVAKAVAAFHGKKSDELLWAEVAWRIGPEEFDRAVKIKISEDKADTTVLVNRAAAFQAFLNRNYPKPETEGGAA